MGREANMRARLRDVPLCAVAVLALSCSVARADDASAASSDGLLKFTNVRVINAPAKVAATGATQSGMRAFKDGTTGHLRGASPEEMQTMAVATTVSSSDKPQFYGPKGGVGVTLDESFLQYTVVVRQPDGSLAKICVTGVDKADEITNGAVSIQAAPQKGARNDR